MSAPDQRPAAAEQAGLQSVDPQRAKAEAFNAVLERTIAAHLAGHLMDDDGHAIPCDNSDAPSEAARELLGELVNASRCCEALHLHGPRDYLIALGNIGGYIKLLEDKVQELGYDIQLRAEGRGNG